MWRKFVEEKGLETARRWESCGKKLGRDLQAAAGTRIAGGEHAVICCW
jgi:hypothetical protein